MTCKIHLATDGKGRPLGLVLTGGNAADTSFFTTVLDTISVRDGRPGRPRTRPDRVLADKAYTSAANRRFLTDRDIKVTIPEREDQKAGRARRGSTGGRPRASTRQHGPTSPDSPWPRHSLGQKWEALLDSAMTFAQASVNNYSVQDAAFFFLHAGASVELAIKAALCRASPVLLIEGGNRFSDHALINLAGFTPVLASQGRTRRLFTVGFD